MGSKSATLTRAPARNAMRDPAESLLTRTRSSARAASTNAAAPRWAAAIPVVSPGERNAAAAPPPVVIQRKLAIGAVDDPLEHEADWVAEQVMRVPEPE